MIKYLIMLVLIAMGAGYMLYDLGHRHLEVQKGNDTRQINSWAQTLDETTIEKKESTKVVKPYTDRPPQEEEVQVQAKTPEPEAPAQVPEQTAENGYEPMPPELGESQRQNWEALQRHNQEREAQQEPQPEPELDGGPVPEQAPVPEEVPIAPPPPVQYGQYPCSYPDCPGNPDVEDYLAKRWRWEGGPGIDVRVPYFQLHVRPWRGKWRRHWRQERRQWRHWRH